MMHYDFLIEDESGACMLKKLLEKGLLCKEDTYEIRHYKGCGSIPKDLKSGTDAQARILLDQLPRLLEGYGKRNARAKMTDAVIIVVCDLDRRDKGKFLSDLNAVLLGCKSKPNVRFCLAVEEGEAWLLGDIPAILKAYPKAKRKILGKYKNDSICDTWELLADAVYAGGSTKLKSFGYRAIGQEKFNWADKITPFMDIGKNKSPSFNEFLQNFKAV